LRASLPGEVIEVITPSQERAAAALGGVANVTDVQQFGARMHVRIAANEGESGIARIRDALRTRGVDVESVRSVPASLEDVFISRVGEAERAREGKSGGGA
jgi:ABC-2 type transport system ATP-binding protein